MAEARTDSTISRPVQVKLVLLGEAAVGKSSVVLRFVSNVSQRVSNSKQEEPDAERDFQENKEPTIGAAFLTQKCRLEDKVIKFEIWDTAGQERFHSAPMYYRNAAAAVVVYDITSATSLEKAKSWVKELQRQANPNIVIAFIGNKLDLVQGDGSSSSSNGDDSSTTIVPSTDSDATGTPSASSSDEDDEADDATATPAAAESHGAGKNRQVPKEEAAAYAQEAGLLFFETSAKTGEGIVDVFTELAKKIPLEQYQGAGGRTGSRTVSGAGRGAAGNNGREGRVNLEENAEQANSKEGCAC